MPVVLKLHVFSGREDPLITLTDDEYQELLKMNVEKFNAAEVGDRGLGYRGFSVMHGGDERIAEELREQFGNSAEHGETETFVSNQPEINEYIVWLAKGFLDDNVVHSIRNDLMLGPVVRYLAPKGCPTCNGQDAPSYNPGFWNTPIRQPFNNCYNYANNQATNTRAQPGKGTGKKYTKHSCSNVMPASVRDGLVSVPNFKTKRSGWYVALVVAPGIDYHWYRQDDNGCWSHKPGSTAARNTDNSGNAITDPATCDRGIYTHFCGYMVTNKNVRIA
ncbi:MAG: hypothetical protein QNJ09_12805 [Paracoccaceae bacterium]|nr:hypothetical protein [Paracoccaceae bacterium]